MPAIAIDKLTAEEKLDLIERLVCSLEPADLPLPVAHREELERRLAEIDAGRVEWVDWSDVKAEMERLQARASA